MKHEDITPEPGTTWGVRDIILVSIWGALLIWLLIHVWLPIIR
jgi:hypothetical protein